MKTWIFQDDKQVKKVGADKASWYVGWLNPAFATQNANRLTAEALQTLMRHKSYLTTQKYINMTCHLDDAAESRHVPHNPGGITLPTTVPPAPTRRPCRKCFPDRTGQSFYVVEGYRRDGRFVLGNRLPQVLVLIE